jgi:CheY-like chemotaxis protein
VQKEQGATDTQRHPCPEPLLILHVNDSTDDQVLLQAAAKEAGVPIEWHVADSVERAISYLKSLVSASAKHTVRWIDLVLLDLVHSDDTGLTVLKFMRNTPELSRVPVVVYTGDTNPATLQAARDLGARDLHEKPNKFQDTVTLARQLYEDWSTSPRS